MSSHSETVRFSPEFKGLDRYEGITIQPIITMGMRAIILRGLDGTTIGTFSAHSAHMMAVALYGATENWTAPPSKEEIAETMSTPEPGDLVDCDRYAGQGEYDGFCLVWSLEMANGDRRCGEDEIMVAYRPGGGIHIVKISEVRVVEKNYRPREWFRGR